MPKLGVVADLVKKPVVFIVIIVIFIGILLAYYSVSSIIGTPSWKGLTPEVSTEKEVKNSLGEPKKQQNIGNNITIFGYKSDFENRLHEVWIADGKLILVKEQVNPKDKKKLKDYKGLKEPADKLYSEDFQDAQVLNYYNVNGLALLTNKNTGLVNEVWYFKPTPWPNFVTKFQINISTSEPARFN